MFRNFVMFRHFSRRLYSKKITDEPQKANIKYKYQRLKKLCQNGNSFQYPHQFQPNTSIEGFLDKFMYLDRGQSLESENGIQVTGRIHSIREIGKSLYFIDLHQNEFRLQIKAVKKMYQGDFLQEITTLARGDIIGVENGHPTKTKVSCICYMRCRKIYNLLKWSQKYHEIFTIFVTYKIINNSMFPLPF